MSDPFEVWTIRSYGSVKSPDFDGTADGQVDLPDLLSFSNEFLGSAPPGCHDYDNDGSTDLDDLLIMSVAFGGRSHCP